MPKRYSNKEHVAWIHEFACCLRAKRDCLGSIQAHHLLKPWEGARGMSLKATDRNVIPLCQRHHLMLHKRGNEQAFFQEQVDDQDFGKMIAKSIWIISPYNRDIDDEV
tara:strand:+ start:168 stop:491 length:324 start_codon:yes stop_codon:yes gene_type:complete